MDGAAGVFHLGASEFCKALFDRGFHEPFALLKRDPFSEAVTVGCTHIVHAYRGDGLHARIDLRCAYGKATAPADAKHTDVFLVDERLRAQEINGRAEIVDINLGRHGVARLPFALAPEGQVEGEGDEALFR